MAYVVNPYNFVPLSNAPTRTAVDAYYTGKLLTGRLDYTLTTDTPLLIPDTAKAVRDEKIDHKCYPFFRLPGGTPTIPGSEIRGAIRAVYEAATDSCLSVLRDSTDFPFSQRLPSTNGFKDHGLLGYDPNTKQWTLYAATMVDNITLTENNYYTIMHSGRVKWNGKDYMNGQHTHLNADGPIGWLQFNQPVTAPRNGCRVGAAYYVRLLAPKPGRSEIFHWQDDTPFRDLCYVLQESAKNDAKNKAHADLLQALQSVKSCDPKQGGLVPVWYLLADDNGTPRCYLSGASIGRVMQGRGWAEIMGSYAPCADIDALCPGCALFGTVKGKGTSGRVRFTDAAAEQYESLGNKTLPILSSPKPSAYEFYLEKPNVRDVIFWNYDFYAAAKRGAARGENPFRAYKPNARGRKFYWHSAPKTITQRSNQNSTLEAMKGVFKGSVYFDRITREQLEELGREQARKHPPAQAWSRQARGIRKLQNRPDGRRTAHPGHAERHAVLSYRATAPGFSAGRPWAHQHRYTIRKEPFKDSGQTEHPGQDGRLPERDAKRERRARYFQLVCQPPQKCSKPCNTAPPVGHQY